MRQGRVSASRSSDRAKDKLTKAVHAGLASLVVCEPLERRMLLSVSASTYAGPIFTTGNSWTYAVTTVDGDTATFTRTVGQQTTFDGHAVTEIDTTIGKATGKDYIALDSAGDIIEYGYESDTTFGETIDTYSPYSLVAPAKLSAGTPVEATDTDTTTDPSGQSDPSTDDDDNTFTLASEDTQSVTVPYGTFDAYKIRETTVTTTTDDQGNETSDSAYLDAWCVPGIGQVRLEDGAGNVYALTSFTSTDEHLVFTTQPTNTDKGDTLDPISVSVEKTDGSVDTDATGSITLSLNSVAGTGKLSGTVTEQLVNGVASFKDLKVDAGGTYTLSATDSATPPVAAGTSAQFEVTTDALTWTGAGDGVNWSDAKNWDGNVKPVNGDSLVFPGGAPLTSHNDITGLSIASIDIQGAGYTLTGNAISLTGSLTSEAGNNTYDIDTKLVGSPEIDDQTGDLTIKSTLSGDNLTLGGSGEVSFEEAGSYTGTTTLKAGITIDDDVLDSVFGDGALTIGAGAAPVTIDAGDSSGVVSIDDDVIFQDGATLAVDPTVKLDGDVTISGHCVWRCTGVNDVMVIGDQSTPIEGSGTITVDGPGTLKLVGALNPNVQIVVNSGVLELDGALNGALGSSQVVVAGGTVQLTSTTSGTGGIDVKYGVLNSASTDGSAYSGTITLESAYPKSTPTIVNVTAGKSVLGTGNIVVNAVITTNGLDYPTIAGPSSNTSVTLSNAVTLLSKGSLSVKGQVSFSQAINVGGDGELFTTDANDDIYLQGGVAGSGTLALGGPGSVEVDGTIAAGVVMTATDAATEDKASPMRLNLNAELAGALAGSPQVITDCAVTFFSTMSGTGGIEVQGGTVSSESTLLKYSGTLTIDSFFFKYGQQNIINVAVHASKFALGTGSLVVTSINETSGIGINGAAVFDFSGVDGGVTLANALTLKNNAAFTFSGQLTLDDTVQLSGNGNFYSSTDSPGTLTIVNGVDGSGTLGISGSTDVTLTGDVDGDVTIANGASGASVFKLGATLEAALDGDPQFTSTSGQTQMLASLAGTGGIKMTGTSILQGGKANEYEGNILFDSASATLQLAGVDGELGTGNLFIKLGELDATANAGGVTISNAVTFQAESNNEGATLIVQGNITFTKALTLSGLTDQVHGPESQTTFNGGIAGVGTLQLGSYGTTTIHGDVAATASLVLDLYLNGDSAPPGEYFLDANLLGAAGGTQVTIGYATVHLQHDLSGSGGLDIQNGTVISEGFPLYSGTITLEQGYPNKVLGFTGLAVGPSITLTAVTGALGTGELVLASPPSDANPAIPLPVIDDSALGGGVTLLNALSARAGAVLNIKGSINFKGETTLTGETRFVTTNAADQVTFSGSIAGSGRLAADGPGTVTILGSVSAQTFLLTADTFTGTFELAGALNGAGGGTYQVHVTAGRVTMLSTLSGGGAIAVTGGTLIGSGEVGYTGSITDITGGTVKVRDSDDAFGLGTGGLMLDGGLLQNSSDGDARIANTVSVISDSQVSSQGLRFKLLGTLTINGNASLDVFGTVIVSGSLLGAGTLTLDGDLLGISGSNPSFTGNVIVHTGTVQVVEDDALGTGDLDVELQGQGVLQSLSTIDPILHNHLIVQSGTLVLEGQFTFPNGVTVAKGAVLKVEGAGTTVVVSGPLAGGGTVATDGGTFTATGNQSGFTGTITDQTGKTVPILTVNDAGGAFTGSPYPATATLIGTDGKPVSSLEGVTPVITYYAGDSVTGTGTNTAPTAAGTYTVIATFAGSTTYATAQSDPVTFVITSAGNTKTTPTIRLMEAGGVFTGSLYAAIVTLTGTTGKPTATLDGVSPTVTYYVGSTATGTGSATPPSAVGTYTVVASFSGSANYNPVTASVKFAITAASTKTTPMLTVKDAGGVFTGSPFAATATLNGTTGKPTATLDGVSPTLTYYVGSTVTGQGSTTPPSAVGTYTVIASFAGSAHYSAVQSTPVTFAITPAAVSLVAVRLAQFSRVVVPGEPLPIGLSTTINGRASSKDRFTYSVSYGDGTRATFVGQFDAKFSHVYKRAGNYTITITATSKAGVTSAPSKLAIKVVAAAVVKNPFNKSESLFVSGTTGNDKFAFTKTSKNAIAVMVNNIPRGTFATSGNIYIEGLGGHDIFTSDKDLKGRIFFA